MLNPDFFKTYRVSVIAVSIIFVLVTAFLSLSVGAAQVGIGDLVAWVSGELAPGKQLIIEQLRVPRVLLSLIVGMLLATSGAVAQGLFRNPLADPALIGVSAGAAVGASVVIVLLNTAQSSVLGLSAVSMGAFVGGVVTVLIVYRVSSGISGTSVATMLLAGIAMTYLAGSISNVLEFIADNEMLRTINLWRMGGLEAANYPRVIIIACVALVIWLFLPRYYNALNALLLGESEARHLGINVNKVKVFCIAVIAASVGVSVALGGLISFIGLIVPHIVRLCVGPNHRLLIPLSACVGALLLMFADAFARSVIAPTELPAGLVTAFIGVPVFISLLRKRHHYGMQ